VLLWVAFYLDLPSKMTRIDKVREVLEDIDNYLIQKRGGSGLPLAYIVREEVHLPLVDPGYGLPTLLDEMVARGPHFGQYYQPDNIEVWQVIRHVKHGGPGWSWVQEFQRTSNGRLAYLAIKPITWVNLTVHAYGRMQILLSRIHFTMGKADHSPLNDTAKY
jgi:hypothetical protein